MILKPPVIFKCSCMTKRHNAEWFLETFVDKTWERLWTERVYQHKSRPVRRLILTCDLKDTDINRNVPSWSVFSSPAAVVKYPAKSDFKNRFFCLALSLRGQAIVVRTWQQQKFEAADHIPFIVRKQTATRAWVQCAFSCFTIWIQAQGMETLTVDRFSHLN